MKLQETLEFILISYLSFLRGVLITITQPLQLFIRVWSVLDFVIYELLLTFFFCFFTVIIASLYCLEKKCNTVIEIL